jgi:hypothetical protein
VIRDLKIVILEFSKDFKRVFNFNVSTRVNKGGRLGLEQRLLGSKDGSGLWRGPDSVLIIWVNDGRDMVCRIAADGHQPGTNKSCSQCNKRPKLPHYPVSNSHFGTVSDNCVQTIENWPPRVKRCLDGVTREICWRGYNLAGVKDPVSQRATSTRAVTASWNI